MTARKLVLLAAVLLAGAAWGYWSNRDATVGAPTAKTSAVEMTHAQMGGQMAAGDLPREMTSTFMAGVAEGAPIVTPRLPEILSDEAQSGKQVFDAKCAVCHGANAAGVKGSGPPLVHKIYEPSHHGDYAVQLAVAQGVRAHHWPFGDMAPVRGVSSAQVAQIVAYMREMQRANGIR